MLLQSGNSATKNGLMYIIKRTTSIPLKHGEFAKEEEVYEIACKDWWKMWPRSQLGYDSRWMTLHDLYSGSTDRAYWSARDTMDRFDIPAPLVEW
jgi:hypothetical protein